MRPNCPCRWYECFQVAVIETAVSETDILASEPEDDAVRAPVWTTSFAEVEQNGVRASVTSRRMSMFLTSSTAHLASTHTMRACLLKVDLSVSTRRLRRCGDPRADCCGSGEFWNFGIRIITVMLHTADARRIPSCLVVQCVRIVS